MSWPTRSRRRTELPHNWASIRRTVLARDGGRCVLCGQPATDVDHIDRLGPHDPTNLRSLCHHCHALRTSADGNQAQREKLKKFKYPERKHPTLKK